MYTCAPVFSGLKARKYFLERKIHETSCYPIVMDGIYTYMERVGQNYGYRDNEGFCIYWHVCRLA